MEPPDTLPDLPALRPTQQMRDLANLINDNCAGSGGAILDPEEEDMEEVDVLASLDNTLDGTMCEEGGSRIVNIRDLVSREIDVGDGGDIRVDDTISFVVLKLDPRVDASWTVPDPDLFNELMNRVICHCFENDLACQRIFKWSNLWGKVGLVGLASHSIDDITEYRLSLIHI